MAQARRKTAKRGGPGRPGRSWSGFGMLLAGVVIGALAMQLMHSGVVQRFAGDFAPAPFASRAPAADATPAEQTEAAAAEPDKPVTDFTFFTVLPGIEVLAPAPPAAETKPAPDAPAADTADAPADARPATVRDATPPAAPASQFMLQAGSYRTVADADRLKATLALNGMVSEIQKVTIQGRGDFYRVRLGPFATYQAMVEVDRQLGRAGIKALRLRMKAG